MVLFQFSHLLYFFLSLFDLKKHLLIESTAMFFLVFSFKFFYAVVLYPPVKGKFLT